MFKTEFNIEGKFTSQDIKRYLKKIGRIIYKLIKLGLAIQGIITILP